MVHLFCTILLVTVTLPIIPFIFMELNKRNGSQIDFEHIDLHNADPMTIWEKWFKEAKTVPENKLPIGMTMATVRSDGHPAARTLLMRGFDKRGFQIYTDYTSPKAEELIYENSAALVFLWCFIPQNGTNTKPVGSRQVRVEGVAEKLSQTENERYFDQEPVDSKVRAIIQRQSERLTSTRREEMLGEARELYRRFEQFPSYKPPMPDKYGGYVIQPRVFEFFQSAPNSLATRVRFRKRTDFGVTLPDGVEPGKDDWVYEYLEF